MLVCVWKRAHAKLDGDLRGHRILDELRYTTGPPGTQERSAIIGGLTKRTGNEVIVIGRYDDDFHSVRVVCGSVEIHLDLLEHWLFPTFASPTFGSPLLRAFAKRACPTLIPAKATMSRALLLNPAS